MLYQALFICKKLGADNYAYLGWGYSKIWLFGIKDDVSVIVNISFSQNIMVQNYWYYFCIFYIFHFFQIIMVSLFLAWHDRYFIMFKDSNVFEFINFPFIAKYNNTLVYSVNSNYLFLGEKQEKRFLIHWRSLISPES